MPAESPQPLQTPLGARPERLDRLPLARVDPRRASAGADRRLRGRRRDLEPVDLPEGDGRRRRLRRAAPRARRRRGGRRGDLLGAGPAGHPRGLRPASRPSGTRGQPRRLRLARGRPAASPTTRSTTYREAMRLHEAVDSPNLMVKIPATKPGLAAIEDVIAKGRSINVTLIFSLQRYAEVAESYVRGLERLVAEGGDPTQGRVGRELLRLAHRHRGRQPPRGDRRPRRAAGQARDRQRASSPTSTTRRSSPAPRWEYLRRQGRDAAARAVGVDVDQEPRLPRHDVRRGADRPRHRQHDARGDDPGLPGPRRAEPRLEAELERRASCSSELAAGRGRLRRRHRHARARGRREIRRGLRRAARARSAAEALSRSRRPEAAAHDRPLRSRASGSARVIVSGPDGNALAST